MTDFATKAAN